MKQLDSFLNSITMYRLVMYGTFLLLVVALGFSFFNLVPFSSFELFLSFVLLVGASVGSNVILSRLFTVPANVESTYITAFILCLIMTPPVSFLEGLGLVLTSVLAISSKYWLSYSRKHIFNPAAFGAFCVSLTGLTVATWWIATPYMLPFVVILGVLVVRKIRRFDAATSFVLTALLVLTLAGVSSGNSWYNSIAEGLMSWPILFLGTIMLTEPLTMPSRRNFRVLYGCIVGILTGYPLHVGVTVTPELALLIGNLFGYIVNPKVKVVLTLHEKKQLAPLIWDFAFKANTSFKFLPGQYLEWTLDPAQSDTRGNRRYFTIASSPTESYIHLGVKIPPQSSTFKQKLLKLNPGDSILAGSLAGDFTLPKNQKKIIAIAGGIGITPFRSMAKYLQDTNSHTHITLFYMSAVVEEFVYSDVLETPQTKVVYMLSGNTNPQSPWKGRIGYITKEVLEAEVPGYQSQDFYLSGPNAMVDAYKKLLLSLNIPRSRIHTDYFPGY